MNPPPENGGGHQTRGLYAMELTEFPARYCRHEDAARKRHSTVGEALGIASQMTAALAVPPCRGGVATEGLLGTVLTHFSQRYPTVPPEQEGGGRSGRTAARTARKRRATLQRAPRE